MLRDPCGRPVTNLRISVTQECNQRCLYCHREGEGTGRRAERMSPGEIGRIARLASKLGVKKVKFTGGEPLLRPDLPEIIGLVAPFFKDTSLTTNGTLLSAMAKRLRAAGLDRVNLSLDSLRPGTYARITGMDCLDDALAGIRAAKEAGLGPVKLNMVVLRGINEGEIPEMLRFAAGEGAILQLIELEAPKGALSGEWYSKYHADLLELEAELLRRAVRTETRKMHHRRKYLVPLDALDAAGPRGDGKSNEGKQPFGTVEVEIVRPVHNSEFCGNCNRLRLSSDGWLVPCLFRRDRGVDILGPVRKGESDPVLEKSFREAVARRRPYWTGGAPAVEDRGARQGACP